MQEKYINYVAASLKNTLDIFIHEDFHLNIRKLKKNQKLPRHYNIHILIEIMGDLYGSLILSINREEALELTSAMTGLEQTEHNEVTYNILKELLNITASNTVQLFADLKLKTYFSAPIIVKGDNIDIRTVSPLISIPMNIKKTDFKISLSFTEKETKSICLVDDDADVLYQTKNLLEENGFYVAGIFSDGIEFLNDFKSISPDIVILDINMPGKDGIEILSHLKIHSPQIKVVMLTTKGEARYVQTAVKLGADSYVIKPARLNLIPILRSMNL